MHFEASGPVLVWGECVPSLNGLKRDYVASFGERQSFSAIYVSYKVSVHDEAYVGPARGKE